MKTLLLKIWQGLNKRLVLIASIVLVVCCAGCIATGIYLKNPEVVAAKSVERFATDALDRDEAQYLAKILGSGSVEASMSSLKLNGEESWEDASIYGKIYFSTKAIMLEDFNFEMNGTAQDSISIKGDVYISDKLAYINEKEILGGAYGAKYDELADNLKNSIFRYGSGSDYAFSDEDTYNDMIQSLENPADEKMAREAAKLVKTYYKNIYKIICDSADFESENDKIRIAGEKVSARIITISIDEDALSDILLDVYDYLKNDDRMSKFLDKYEDSLRIYFSDMILKEDEDKSLSEIYEDYLDELEDEIDDACENIKKQETELEIEIVTPKNSSKLLQLTVSTDNNDLMKLTVGKDGIKDTDEIKLNIGESSIVCQVEQDDKDGYESFVKVNGEKVLSIEIDKDRNRFEIFAGGEETNLQVKGDITTVRGTTTIDVKRITYNYLDEEYYWGSTMYVPATDTYETNLRIIIREKDRMPKPINDFMTIDRITDEDMEKWSEKIEK